MEVQIKISKWISFVQEQIADEGVLQGEDLQGNLVLLEYKTRGITSPDLAAFKREISEMASRALTEIELEHVRSRPEAVSTDYFLKECSPFFEKGLESVDWAQVEETIYSTIKRFYLVDLASFGEEVIRPLLNDLYYYVSIKEKGSVVGFLMASITPALPEGTIKLINLAILPENEGRGLEQLLLGTLFKLIPQITQLFTITRPTNESAISTYQSCGFVQSSEFIEDPHHVVDHSSFLILKYDALTSDFLQNMKFGIDGIVKSF